MFDRMKLCPKKAFKIAYAVFAEFCEREEKLILIFVLFRARAFL